MERRTWSPSSSFSIFSIVPGTASLGEEWIFRGYPLSRLDEVAGKGWANILVALLFMAGHWGGEGWNALPAVNIFLFSLVAGAIRYTPGGIPAAWGFHLAWNCLYALLGATVIGLLLLGRYLKERGR